MNIKDFFIPDEIQSAYASAKNMLRDATRTSRFWIKQIFAAALPVAAGCYLTWRLSSPELCLNQETIRSIVFGVMTLSSVLAGFLVTLMLFTGRSPSATALTLDQTEDYVGKVKYLLFSQAATLVIHLLVITIAIAWLIAEAASSGIILQRALLSCFAGTLFLSLVRTLLLPFQIYEIHEFELNSLISEKKNIIREQLAKERKEEN